MNQSFVDADDIPAEITGTCFYQENLDPDKSVVDFDIFPPNTVCTFIRCNMVNVHKQAGFTYIDCQEDTICVQDDLIDWHTDGNGNPLIPTKPERFEELGIPIDPTKIVKMSDTPITREVRTILKGLS
jgi:hypothetical protein